MFNGPRIQTKTIYFLFKKYMSTKNVKFHVLTKNYATHWVDCIKFFAKIFFYFTQLLKVTKMIAERSF